MADARQPIPEAGGDLARLLDVEAGLEQMLEKARQEAAAMLRAARGKVERDGEESARALEREKAELRAALDEERDARLAEIDAEARRECARFDGVGEDAVRRLVAHVVQRVVTGEAGP